MQKREKAKGNQHIVKHGQNRGQPKNHFIEQPENEPDKPSLRKKRLANRATKLKSKGNIYQHAALSIEGNVNCLLAKLGANFRTNDFHVANAKRTENAAVFQSGEDRRGYAIDFREVLEIGEHAVGVFVAIVEKLPGKLLVTIAGIGGKKQGIFFGEQRSE